MRVVEVEGEEEVGVGAEVVVVDLELRRMEVVLELRRAWISLLDE